MKRVLTLAAILGLAALAPISSASAANPGCPSSSVMVAAPSYTVQNGLVEGVLGNVWATDTYTRTVAVYRVNPTTYCAIMRDVGTYTTIAGPSPAGTGFVAGGLRGRVSGS